MADLPSTQAVIQLEEVQFQDSIGEGLFTKLGSAINYLIDNNVVDDLGSVQESILIEAEFQTQRDATWVIMDGRDITGSDLETTYGFTTIPDMETRFARVVDDGAGVDTGRVVMTEQEDVNVAHTHLSVNNTGSVSASFSGSFPYLSNSAATDSGSTFLGGDDAGANVALTTDQGSSAFRPNNITINYFIKINL